MQRSFVSTENADYSESTLLELTPAGFVERASVRGVVDNVAGCAEAVVELKSRAET